MLVAFENQSYEMSGQTSLTAGVSPMMSKVSLCIMSHWSALSLLSARVRTEEGHVKAPNKDNPQNSLQEQVSATSDTPEDDRGHKMVTVSWGAYLYGAVYDDT
jgi:hypothetical protein